jgi:ActR/RegA family two-component response regulator
LILRPSKLFVIDIFLAPDEPSGLEVLERVRGHSWLITAIMLTGWPKIEMCDLARSLGAKRCLAKPSSAQEIIDAALREDHTDDEPTLEQVKQRHALMVLAAERGNVTRAARRLDVSRSWLIELRDRFEPDRRRPGQAGNYSRSQSGT